MNQSQDHTTDLNARPVRLRCPQCGSTGLEKRGRVPFASGSRQLWRCVRCSHYFYDEPQGAAKAEQR